MFHVEQHSQLSRDVVCKNSPI